MTMIIDDRPAGARPVRLPALEGVYIGLLAAFVLFLGCAPFIPDGLNTIASDAANSVFSALVTLP